MKLLLSLIFLVSSLGAFAQVTSINSGDWNTPGNWSCTCVPGSTDDVVISPFDVITISSGSQQAQSLLVDSDGTLNIDGGSLVVSGTIDVTVGDGFFTFDGFLNLNSGGALEGQNTVTSSSGNFQVDGTYTHNQNGGAIPQASWNSGSTLIVSGITTTAPTGLDQTFYNLTWNSTHSSPISLLGQLTSIQNDFNILDTGGPSRQLILSTNTNTVLNVLGNMSVQNNSVLALVQTGPYTLNVNGDLTISSSAATTLLFTATGSPVINVTGNFSKSNAGNIIFSSGAGGVGTLNITGNYTQSGGTLTETNSGNGNINFVGPGPHIVSKTGGSIANTINITNAVGSTLDLGTSILEGAGAFTNNGTLRVGSTHANGALQSTTILDSDCGNIIMSGTRTYANPSTIEYNGSGLQFIGDGHPTTAGVNITVANSNGVSIIAPTTLAGAINLASGNLNVNNSSLTITGSVTGANNITVGSTGSITLGGSANIGTFPFPAGAQSFANFTLSNSNGITFDNDVSLSGVLTLNTGALRFNDRSLNLDGTLSVTSGSLSCNSSSSLNITGEGSFGSALNFASGGNTIGTLVIDRTVNGMVDINSTLTIATSLILENGQFQNTNGLTMGNGSTLTRRGGTLTTERPDVVSGSYNVTYNSGSSINTSLELPGPADATHLNNLTISGPTVLTQNITVNGNVTLTSGTFSAGTNTITMQGSTWSRNGGSFVPGTGLVDFNGTTSITSASGSPQFGNISVGSGRTLNFPASTVNLSGNVTFLAGSTVNANGGTILLNGTGAQNVGGGGSTMNNVTVTKTGGSITLTSALAITGVLNITTATIFSSANNLTLISTSDGTTGNASIASLAGGGSVTGDVTVQRFMSAESRFWRYLSSPIQNGTVDSWKDDFPITGSFTDPSLPGEWPVFTPPLNSTAASLYRYDETIAGAVDLGWEAYPSAGLASANALDVGRGYSTFVRNTSATTIDVTGPINSGNIPLPVSLTGSPSVDNGWNLVGNPYPATINWDAANWTKTNISGSIQVRDDPSGIFRAWNGSVGSLGSGRIAMGQAFWVQASGSSPSLIATEQVKTTTTGAFYRQEEEPVTDAFEIILAKGNDRDFTYIWFKEDASKDYDTQYDVVKFHNDIFDLSSFTMDNEKLAINTLNYLSCGESISLDVSTANSGYNMIGTYEFTFNAIGTTDPNLTMVLFDSFTGSTINVQNGTMYSFEVTSDENSYGSNRFKIILLSGSPAFSIDEVFDGTSCNTGTAILSATGAPVGGLYKWYESETGGTALFESTDPNFTTPELDKSTTFFVAVANEYGCESGRVAVEAVVVHFDEVAIEKNGNTLISSYTDGNQWYVNNEPIEGATSREFQPTESGSYSVEVTIDGCVSRADYDFLITDLEKDFATEWSYYPNPVSQMLTIRTTYPVNQIRDISVVNSIGLEIGKITVNAEGIGYFDMESRPGGIYVIKILGSGKSVNFKIIKQ